MLSESDLSRYERQIMLNGIGIKGQEKLKSSKVLVAGAGGLGSPAAYYLAAAGIGTIGLADFDEVSLSNLNRQILHRTNDIGRFKIDSAAEKLSLLNPDVQINKHCIKLTPENIADTVKNYDVIIDAVDNFETRFLINDSCYFLRKPVIEGAVCGFEGLLMTVVPGKTPCYRCLYPDLPKEKPFKGVIGMTAGAIGSLQAFEAVKLLLGIGEPLLGRLLIFDGLNSSFRVIDWSKKRSCPLCGENATIKNPAEA
ncbi:MAG: HesA/MoeB/ThiF family protein [Oscillospiraceae bacterium]|nr:HesA/MoeB/ThiF family protein [Oscillospiraceae bacterium]